MTLTFHDPVNALGIDVVDFGDVPVDFSGLENPGYDLTLSVGGGSESTILSSLNGSRPNGNSEFIGILDLDSTFTTIGFFDYGYTNSFAHSDSIGLDFAEYGAASHRSIPEPSTLFLLGSGLGGLVVLGRKSFF
jgi:hypothetical protein